MNEANATVGSNALVLGTSDEKALGQRATAIERQATSMVVNSDVGYAAAGELLKKIKGVQKAVKEYWEPLRKSAKVAYDNVNAKKKAMLDPLERVEATLKGKMSEYAMEQERIRRAREEEMRRAAKEEADRLLAEAIEASNSGDDAGADSALAVAEVYDDVAAMTTKGKALKPKAEGVSLSQSWKITGIDSSKVPISFNGTEIRPVDTAAILRLIKEAKGQISIPGVTFAEDFIVSAKA